MGSKYPKSVRVWLPLWALTLEVIFIVVFFFFTSHPASAGEQKKLLRNYRAFQDVFIMATLGFGFLNTSLRRHCWSSIAFNLFLLALGVQLAVLLDGFLIQLSFRKMVLDMSSIQKATMSATSVLISAGVVLGKVNLLQLVFMTLIEVTALSATRLVGLKYFSMDNHVSMMYIHMFAAYFGLTVVCCLQKPLPSASEDKDQTATSPSLFTMLGTLFLWMFWPSFNSALLDIADERKKAVLNTYYALAVSTVTATLMSALTHPQGKINMTHIHNAVLAGGVVVGAPSYLIHSPWLAMVLGFVAGVISIGGVKYLQVCLQRTLELHDTYGVHYTFGLPGLLGGIVHIVLMVLQAQGTDKSTLGYQVLINVGALGFTIIMGVTSGLLTGLLLNLNIWKSTHKIHYFDDQSFWKFPRLAVGY
ncbi:RH-like protein IC [Moschus berezovskii]|uniref:Ammonium transporter AmtB-like domain-containing protein n=1 Tax=Moschus moschiferus TaxID=68415 RepID=A0A8C6D0R5_MOSMO|nr:RH-like protein IC [Moschus berezovskii]